MKDFAVIVLAAGEGKRMQSPLSKVLHEIGGEPMIAKTLGILKKVNLKQIILVANPKNVGQIKKITDGFDSVIQRSPLGTADAVRVGLEKVDKSVKNVAVMYGDDSAFYKAGTITKVFDQHKERGAKITFVTVIKENPEGLGRIIRKDGKLQGIVEEKDASEDQRKIKEVNDGLYFFDKEWILDNLCKLKPSPVTGELYVTDLIELALNQKQKVETYLLEDAGQWHPINTQEELKAANLKVSKRTFPGQNIHFMGIAGAGAAAVAGIAKAHGFQVSGCDLNSESAYGQNLEGIMVEKGHSGNHLIDCQILVVSPAILKFGPKNPEVAQAKKLGIPVMTWQEFQGEFLQKDKFVIAIAGAYGKTTTTAMLSQILIDQGLDPTCEVGAKVLDWGANFKVGKSKYYICEADEYNNNFLNYKPDIAVVLNISWEHPDFFKSGKEVFKAYKKFVARIKKGGTLVFGTVEGMDDVASLRKDIKILRIEDFGKTRLSLIGDFRRENANAALAVSQLLGLDLEKAKASLENFKGCGRRLEYKGKIGKVEFYDDYAVQPYTILKTSDALKEKFGDKRVLLVFEPHTFSRIKTFFDDFVKSLKDSMVDQVLITQVYGAREIGDKRKLAQELTEGIGPKAHYSGSIEETANYIEKNLIDFDVILSMGAGDVYKIWDLIKNGR